MAEASTSAEFEFENVDWDAIFEVNCEQNSSDSEDNVSDNSEGDEIAVIEETLPNSGMYYFLVFLFLFCHFSLVPRKNLRQKRVVIATRI